MKVLGIGLSKTGTTSLANALEILGLKCLHYDSERLASVVRGTEQEPDFRLYDDVDAVTDLPAAFFFKEILLAYPKAKAVLTLRDPESWYSSISRHFNQYSPALSAFFPSGVLDCFRLLRKRRLETPYELFKVSQRNYIYGATNATRFLYQKRFNDFNEYVQLCIPGDRLLVMDVTKGDGWEKLCPFLGYEVPSVSFPWSHRSSQR